MVGSHRIAQQCQYVGILDIVDRVRFFLEPFEERRMLDVGGFIRPLVHLAFRHLDGLPGGVAIEDFRVFLTEHIGLHFLHRFSDLLLARPEVLQVHRVAILVVAQRIF